MATSPTPKSKKAVHNFTKGKVKEILENQEYNFFDALVLIHEGKSITRKSWNNPDIFFHMHQQGPDKMLFVKLADGRDTALLVTDKDMEATDYIVIK